MPEKWIDILLRGGNMKKIDKKLAFIVATALTQTLTELRRDGIPVENITNEKFLDIFTLLRKKKIVPDAMSILFIYFAFNPDAKIEGAVAYTGTAIMKKSAVKKVIKRVVAEQSEYIESRGENAINRLMGIAMKELRGKVDGKTVRDLLLSEVQNIINKGK